MAKFIDHNGNETQYVYATCEHTYGETEHTSFGFVDNKGREVGVWVRRHVEVRTEVEKGKTSGLEYANMIGKFFCFQGNVTRDGKTYGAGSHGHNENAFRTEEERETAIVKYVAGVRNRNVKKFCK